VIFFFKQRFCRKIAMQCVKEILFYDSFLNQVARRGVKELIFYESFSGKVFLTNSQSSLLGLQKKSSLFDIEYSLMNYLKVIALVRFFDRLHLKILFLGSPHWVKRFAARLLAYTRHLFIELQDRQTSTLVSKKKFRPVLILSFKRENLLFAKDFLSKNISFACFVDEATSLTNLDYPVVINVNSVGALKMFLNILKQLYLFNYVK
jgi:hypothetical protein